MFWRELSLHIWIVRNVVLRDNYGPTNLLITSPITPNFHPYILEWKFWVKTVFITCIYHLYFSIVHPMN